MCTTEISAETGHPSNYPFEEKQERICPTRLPLAGCKCSRSAIATRPLTGFGLKIIFVNSSHCKWFISNTFAEKHP